MAVTIVNMAGTGQNPMFTGFNAVEDNGLIKEVRLALRYKATFTGASTFRDIIDKLFARKNGIVPNPGERFFTDLINDETGRADNLFVQHRQIQAVNKTSATEYVIDVDVVYRFWPISKSIDNKAFGPILVDGNSATSQILTSRAHAAFNPKNLNDPATVTYNGNTVTREMTAFIPNSTLIYEEVGDTPLMSTSTINHDLWNLGEPGTWMLLNRSSELVCNGNFDRGISGGNRLYLYRYEFHYNPYGWAPELIYLDSNNQLPKDFKVDPPNGYKKFDTFYTIKMFSPLFNSYFPIGTGVPTEYI